MNNKLLFCILFLSCYLFTGCIVKRIHVPSRIWKIETPNPTNYTYQVSMDSLIRCMENNFKNNKNLPWKYVRTDQHKFGFDYCIQMYSKSSSLLYRTKRGRIGCPYFIELYLCCDSINPQQTEVTTTVYYSFVNTGGEKEYSWNHDVPPTSIEEYQLLRLIGKFVGERDMPPVCYPKKLPAKELEILNHIYQ